MRDDSKFAKRDEYEALHEKVDDLAEGQAEIKGMLKGMESQKKNDMTFYGMLAAFVLGIWNLLIK